MRSRHKLTLAVVVVGALQLLAVVDLANAEDVKEAFYDWHPDSLYLRQHSAAGKYDGQDAYENNGAYHDDTKATPPHTQHRRPHHRTPSSNIYYVDPPGQQLGQSYNIPVLRRTMPWPEGTTLAQLAAQASSSRQQMPGVPSADAERTTQEHMLGAARARHALVNRRLPEGQAKAPVPTPASLSSKGWEHLDAVPPAGSEAAPLRVGSHGEYDDDDERHRTHADSVDLSITGLTAFERAGNVFTSGVPDQGLCVGRGLVLESVNNVLRVYSAKTGAPITPALSLNAFYGYRPDYDATSQEFGPFMTDPVCWYDTKSRRWFHVILTLAVNPSTGGLTGPNFLDVAVSTSSDPTGEWNYYQVPAANDGTNGMPDFQCRRGPCLGDYPQLAVWDHAVVITVNEFAVLGSGFYGVMVYALDKDALVQGLAAANTVLVNPGVDGSGALLDTLIPASQSSACELRNEFLMSTSGARATGRVDTVRLLRLRDTASLSTANPTVTLEWVEPEVKLPFQYTYPPNAVQKAGVNPLGIVDYNNAPVTLVDTSDGRMASVTFVDDRLYAAWGTEVAGVAGAAWALVDPRRPAAALDGGVIGLPNGNNLLFPYLAVRAGGEGVMALAVAGPDYYPSPAYALLTRHGLGPVKLIASGAGPLDDFDGYDNALANGPPGSARYGDYVAALVDETGAFWLASEWVAQACSVAQYNGTAPTYADADPTCRDTRSRAANWATRVTKVTVT